jgi:hypothetical protein
MNEYQPLKVEAPAVTSQGTAFVTDGKKGKGAYKRLPDDEWNALSNEEKAKFIKACKKGGSEKPDGDDKSISSSKSVKSTKSLSKTIKALEKENKKLKKSVALQQHEEEDSEESDDSSISSAEEGSSHFQDALEMLEATHPKIVLALKNESVKRLNELDLRNVLLLDNQSTFDLCCNKKFTSKIIKGVHTLHMKSNGGGLKITEKCEIPGYKFKLWFSKKAITNIICLKNLIKCYRVTYDSEVDTSFVVHRSAHGLPDLLFEMHPCGLHVCYPTKMGEFGFIQTVEENMKLFSKRQIAGAVQARNL